MNFRFSFFRLLLTFTLASFGNSAFSGTTQAATNTLLVYGDSLSAAYGIPREQGWVALLQQRLQKQGFQVVNASISGETTSGGSSRILATLEQYKPGMVLIELGANDGLRGLPLHEMQRNLTTMIKASQRAGARVILIGIKIPPNYGPRYTDDFYAIYSSLAQKFNVPLVPFLLEGVAGKQSLVQEDGLHPLAIAQSRILETVWQVLAPEVRKIHARFAPK
jgi:acyl-CoA thioesterase-1